MNDALQIETFTLGPFATHCYLLWPQESKECWIIDASFDPGEMIGSIQAAGLRPQALILTHGHLDHIAGVDSVRATFPGVPVLIHEAEKDWLTDPDLNLSGAYGLPIATSAGPDDLLRDGQVLRLGPFAFKVLHTPGHSPGGIGLHQAGEKLLLAGDTLFFDSIGRTDFPNADGAVLLRSIREKLLILPDDTRVYPGHGPATSIGREKLANPFLGNR